MKKRVFDLPQPSLLAGGIQFLENIDFTV